MPTNRYLTIYLSDHLAGATGGVRLARRLLDSNREDERLGQPLARLCAEIEADRTTLLRVMDALDASRSRTKEAAAVAAEKLGRLKLNGHLRGYSPLSRVIELEALQIGIAGKAELWRTLAQSKEAKGFDFEDLIARAEMQRDAAGELHRLAVDALVAAP